MPGPREWERRQQEALDRVREMGVVEPVGTTLGVEGHEVEIVATLADCVETVILYRAPREAMLHPELLWPPEAAMGGSHGTMLGDLLLTSFPPVQPHRKSIGVTFRSGRSSYWEDPGVRLTVPINRAATAGYDRHLAETPDAVEQDGLAVSILDVSAGMMSASVDLLIEAIDPDVLGFELEWPLGFRRHHGAGPGPEALWRDWFPEPQSGGQVIRRRLSSTMEFHGASLGFGDARGVIRARKRPNSPPPAPRQDAEPSVRFPISVREVPTGASLQLTGWGGGSGPRAGHNVTAFRSESPSRSATHLEAELLSTYVHRYGGGEVVVLPPAPADASRAEIGVTVEIDGGSMEFVAWEPDPYNPGTTLVVRMPSADWYPDIRLIIGEESLSFVANRSPEGTVRCRLMQRDVASLDQPGGVPVALRMIGRPIKPVRFKLPLTPA